MLNSHKNSLRLVLWAPIILLLLFLYNCSNSKPDLSIKSTLILDKEEKVNDNKVLTSSTQSLNRYHSVLRNFKEATINYNQSKKTISLQLSEEGARLSLNEIEARFLLPILPYKHDDKLNDFDKANITLAEFARNGISLSHQENNTKFGYFNSSSELFNDEAEYQFDGKQIIPNNRVRPKRFSIINNCLNPGLWELSATDAVGEMFHSWFTLPKSTYFEMLKNEIQVENSVEELSHFVETNDEFKQIPAELEKLRSIEKKLFSTTAILNNSKEIGAYSSQDSRRKVQRGFYKIKRDTSQIEVKSFKDLKHGDVFSLHSFKNPGVYLTNEKKEIKFNPEWSEVVLTRVKPKTFYGGVHDDFSKFGYIEIELFSKDKSKSILAGNIPVQLLTFGEDYRIPAFGAGVLDASEPIERRYLRFNEGPYPHYAYLLEKKGQQDFLINNHSTGYEQIYFRPFLKDDELFLKMTIVSYERIVDLLEFIVPIEGTLKDQIIQASKEFKKPIYEVYQDSNIF